MFGVFGSFTFYLPELFPTRLRGFGPLVVGSVAARGVDYAMQAIAFVALVPLAGLVLVPFIIETRGRPLAD